MANENLMDGKRAATLLKRLTMTELRALGAVRSAGTMSGAAQMLDVSQPTLSQHVRRVEEKLDTALFERHRRGIVPTPAGALLLRLASALQADFAQAAEELSIALRADMRPIRIASMAVTSGGLLALALGRFASTSPNPVPTVVLEGPRELLLEHLRHGRADIFVGRLPDKTETQNLYRELLCLDTAVVIASSRHPLVSRRRIDLNVLHSQRWVVPADDTAFYGQIAQTLRHAGCPPPNSMVHSYSMHAIPAIVATSDLLGFLPMSLYGTLSGTGNLRRLPFDLPWVPAEVGLLARPGVIDEGRLQPLLVTLRAVAGSARVAGGDL